MKENNELSHHGIKGQRWGVRRYQYKDGSLTPAGRKRVAKLKDEYTSLTGKRLIKKPSSKNAENTTKKKSVKEMSDTELREKINRLQMEKQALNLQSELGSKGEKFVSTVNKQVVTPAAIDAGKRLLTDVFMKVGKDKLGLNPETTTDALSDLRKEVDTLELNKRKAVAEDFFTKREEKKKSSNDNTKNNKSDSNGSKKEEPKAEKVKAEFVKDKKSDKSTTTSKSKESVIIDADWEDLSVNSTDLVPYRERGKSYLDELLKK